MTSSLTTRIAPLIIALVGFLWLKGLIGIVVDLPRIPWLTAGPIVLLVCAALLIMPRQIRVMCAVLGLATAGLAAGYDKWDAILGGLERAAIFPAFLAARRSVSRKNELPPSIRMRAAVA